MTTIPRREKVVWFYAADAGRARLLRCRSVPPGRLHVEEHDALDFEPDVHEHGRPSPRVGKQGNSYASGGHEDDHQLRRFAKQVAGWIERTMRVVDGERVALFSAPRFLGELRKLWPEPVSRRLEAHASDLSSLSPGQLEGHPAVARLYDEGRA